MDGAAIDGGWYLDMLAFAKATPWLHGFFEVFTNAGLLLYALAAAVAWWLARGDARRSAAVLWVPIAVLLAYAVSNLLKITVREPRPCLRYPAVPPLFTCDFATDWSFPSNHMTIAAAAAVALLLAHRQLGLGGLAVAAVIGFSRIYLGAHYVHDVLAGAVLGTLVALCGLVARAPLTAIVSRSQVFAFDPRLQRRR
ncbi:phosphatase PAP2 family protein [Amycolatopsis sp. cmx-4-61]|uniref:phosphatase PAP2 family protein n=1 Tax=Amycolatopsis sp. cmx-4-61 TaxID=2790937 RepID=UPI00397B1AB1